MAGINDYSNTAGSNTTINGIDIAEGCSPAGINNAIRQLMADIADMDDGVVPLQTPDINGGTIDGAIIGGTTPAAGTFTNLTATGTLTGLLGNVVEDVTPQLGGDLDLNSNDITGTGNINITGTATVTGKGTFSGAGSFEALELITSDTNRVYVTGNSSVSGDMWRIGTSASNPYLNIDGLQASSAILFRTGGTNERMRIDSSGNVGIGSSTARGRLTVSDGNTNSAGEAVYQAYIVGTARNFTSDATGMLTIQSTDNMGANKGGSIAFGGRAITGNASGANWAGISGFKENSTSGQYGGYLGFSVRNNVGGGALAEAMRINSSGNVGIGITNPIYDLDISSDNPVLRITDTDGAARRASLSLETAGGPWVMETDNNLSIRYSSPGVAATSGSFITLGRITSPLIFGTNATEAMRIDSSGNVSIGKTSSAGKSLELYASTNTAMRIQNSTTGTTGGDGLLIEMGGSDALIYNYENGVMKFGTNNAESMRIDNQGSVLINNLATPHDQNVNAGFKVYGTGSGATVLGLVSIARYQGEPLILNRVNNDGRLIGLQGKGVTRGEIAVSGTVIQYTSYSDHRLKEDVQQISNSTESLKQLNPVNFAWIDGGVRMNGFLAHEVQSVVPEAVTGTHNEVDSDGNPVYQGIDQSKLVPLLVATIKELEARITALENA